LLDLAVLLAHDDGRILQHDQVLLLQPRQRVTHLERTGLVPKGKHD